MRPDHCPLSEVDQRFAIPIAAGTQMAGWPDRLATERAARVVSAEKPAGASDEVARLIEGDDDLKNLVIDTGHPGACHLAIDPLREEFDLQRDGLRYQVSSSSRLEILVQRHIRGRCLRDAMADWESEKPRPSSSSSSTCLM